MRDLSVLLTTSEGPMRIDLSKDERQSAIQMFGENFEESPSPQFWAWYDYGRRPDGTFDAGRIRVSKNEGDGLPKSSNPGW